MGSPVGPPGWPVRTGPVPALAGGFTARLESAPDLMAALIPGTVVALVPEQAVARHPGDWLEVSGKTQLAVSFAESLWQSAAVDLIAWVPATSRASVLSGYLRAAAAVGTDVSGTAESAAGRFLGWLAETGRPWLMVLDDLRDAADLDGLWPRGGSGRVLITTTQEGTVFAERRAQVFPVGAFSAREALSYLVGRLAGDPDQRHGAIDLAAGLGGEAPALAHASAVIASSTLSCHDYQGYFAHRCTELSQHAGGGRLPSAAVTWPVSAEQADRLAPGGATALLLALAALLDGHPAPAAVFTSAAACGYLADGGGQADPGQAWEAVRGLERTGLLAIDAAAAPPVVRMSRVLAAQVRAATPEPLRDRAAQAAADALAEVWPAEEPQPWLAAGLRSCLAGLQHAAGDRLWTAAGCHPLLLRAGQSISGARLTGPAVGYWTQLAATSERILGPGSAGTLLAGSELAEALLATGQAGEAVTWRWRVLDGRARLLGPGHPDTLAARVALGQAMLAAGQPKDAVTVLTEAVSEHEQADGPGDPVTLRARDELAAAVLAAGQRADAVRLYQRTLADWERIQGPHGPGTVPARERLGGACLASGQLKEAISCYKQALADRERVLGRDHPDTLAARSTLAAAYHAAGKMAAALKLHHQAVQDYQRVLGPDHPQTLARCGDLARAYWAAGRVMDAQALLRDTLSRCEQALPPGDPLTQALGESMTGMAG
ncbi:MAG: tetratricopeptide repeat protein [Streptosporangiales bacterium]